MQPLNRSSNPPPGSPEDLEPLSDEFPSTPPPDGTEIIPVRALAPSVRRVTSAMPVPALRETVVPDSFEGSSLPPAIDPVETPQGASELVERISQASAPSAAPVEPPKGHPLVESFRVVSDRAVYALVLILAYRLILVGKFGADVAVFFALVAGIRPHHLLDAIVAARGGGLGGRVVKGGAIAGVATLAGVPLEVWKRSVSS